MGSRISQSLPAWQGLKYKVGHPFIISIHARSFMNKRVSILTQLTVCHCGRTIASARIIVDECVSVVISFRGNSYTFQDRWTRQSSGVTQGEGRPHIVRSSAFVAGHARKYNIYAAPETVVSTTVSSVGDDDFGGNRQASGKDYGRNGFVRQADCCP